jgi:hypothetical protein
VKNIIGMKNKNLSFVTLENPLTIESTTSLFDLLTIF